MNVVEIYQYGVNYGFFANIAGVNKIKGVGGVIASFLNLL